mmetsp:Transcript_8817/g.14529  ORF Transcript_8817/g.14529 Transcript_8817/m.14529 type:complete len:216 (-) Transcript_8817:598-1245(-)
MLIYFYSVYGLSLFLDKISNVHRHLSDLSLVELFDITEVTYITLSKKVDSNSLTTETTRSTNTMDVVLTVGGQVEVDNKRHLLDINTTSKKIGGNQHTGGTRAELSHDNVTLTLVHISVHAGDSEITLLHLLLQPVNLTTGITVDDGLSDGQSLVQITKGIQLPFFSLNGNVKLLNTLKSQLILLNKDSHRIPHETLGDFQHIQRHGSGEKAHLN